MTGNCSTPFPSNNRALEGTLLLRIRLATLWRGPRLTVDAQTKLNIIFENIEPLMVLRVSCEHRCCSSSRFDAEEAGYNRKKAKTCQWNARKVNTCSSHTALCPMRLWKSFKKPASFIVTRKSDRITLYAPLRRRKPITPSILSLAIAGCTLHERNLCDGPVMLRSATYVDNQYSVCLHVFKVKIAKKSTHRTAFRTQSSTL